MFRWYVKFAIVSSRNSLCFFLLLLPRSAFCVLPSSFVFLFAPPSLYKKRLVLLFLFVVISLPQQFEFEEGQRWNKKKPLNIVTLEFRCSMMTLQRCHGQKLGYLKNGIKKATRASICPKIFFADVCCVVVIEQRNSNITILSGFFYSIPGCRL